MLVAVSLLAFLALLGVIAGTVVISGANFLIAGLVFRKRSSWLSFWRSTRPRLPMRPEMVALAFEATDAPFESAGVGTL